MVKTAVWLELESESSLRESRPLSINRESRQTVGPAWDDDTTMVQVNAWITVSFPLAREPLGVAALSLPIHRLHLL